MNNFAPVGGCHIDYLSERSQIGLTKARVNQRLAYLENVWEELRNSHEFQALYRSKLSNVITRQETEKFGLPRTMLVYMVISATFRMKTKFVLKHLAAYNYL